MTPEEQHFVEAIRAQRTEALDNGAQWFAKFVAAKERIKELEEKYEPKPKLEAVA